MDVVLALLLTILIFSAVAVLLTLAFPVTLFQAVVGLIAVSYATNSNK